MEMLFGILVGVLGAWVYRSRRARELAQRGISGGPGAIQQATRTVASTAAMGAQRASEAIDAAPLPETVKAPASEAAFNLWAAADHLGQGPSQESTPP